MVAVVAFSLVPIGVNIAERFTQGSAGMWVGIGVGCLGVVLMMVNVGSIFWRSHQETVDEVLAGGAEHSAKYPSSRQLDAEDSPLDGKS